MKGSGIRFKPRIDLENRTRLETVIPLETPFVIFVDPSDRCNLRCRFCPTGDRKLIQSVNGRNSILAFELFEKILEDIQDFPDQLKVLRLYKDGEPLLNPAFFEMVRLARTHQKIQRIDTTTNAVLLTNKKVLAAMLDCELDRVNISIYGMTDTRYREFCRSNVKVTSLIEAITTYCLNKPARTEVIIKINGDIISEYERALFVDTFGPVADGIYIEHVIQCWPMYDLGKQGFTANPDVGIYGQPVGRVEVCPYIFYSISVNSDGSVSACFLDWKRSMVVGNIKTQQLKFIWKGESLQRLRVTMLKKERRLHPICANCQQLTHGWPDNIDDYSEELLKRILEKDEVSHL